jgi:hypothetical protein
VVLTLGSTVDIHSVHVKGIDAKGWDIRSTSDWSASNGFDIGKGPDGFSFSWWAEGGKNIAPPSYFEFSSKGFDNAVNLKPGDVCIDLASDPSGCIPVTNTPIPGALWLFASALLPLFRFSGHTNSNNKNVKKV